MGKLAGRHGDPPYFARTNRHRPANVAGLENNFSVAGRSSGGNSEIDVGPDTENGYSFQVEATGRGERTGKWLRERHQYAGNPYSLVIFVHRARHHDVHADRSTGRTVVRKWRPKRRKSPERKPGSVFFADVLSINSGAPSSSSTSSPANQPPATPPSPSSSETGGQPPAGNPPPSGTPYYTPQIQIETYGTTPTGTFLAENQNQGILLSWQNLSAQTTEITVSRSESEDGPWTTVLLNKIQHQAAYMLQLIDSTVGIPYYYQMSASQGGDVNLTYGPVYVPAP